MRLLYLFLQWSQHRGQTLRLFSAQRHVRQHEERLFGGLGHHIPEHQNLGDQGLAAGCRGRKNQVGEVL